MSLETRARVAPAEPAAPPQVGPGKVTFWLATAMVTGAVIMGLEILAFRLYAPYFGYSIYVWGTMISVVMAALSAGYALGGWLADRRRSDLPLYAIVLSSGVYQLVIVFVVRRLLVSLSQAGEFTGTAVASLIIFAPPMTALATTSPYLIRLLARTGQVGLTAGKVYALATLGSMAGILSSAFWLIPQFGTRTTLEVLCAISVVIGVAGLVVTSRAALVLLLSLGALLAVPRPRLSPGEVWRAESAYNMVRVIHSRGYWLLALNDGRYAHTTRKDGYIYSGTYQDDFVLGPLLVRARRLLVLGMGAGGSIAVTRPAAPEIQVDAVEIDPKVVEAATRYFGIDPQAAWLRIHEADARPWLMRDRASYDLVHVDLYHGGPYVPFYLVTKEFFELARARMVPEGLLLMNVYDLSPEHELLNATGATLRHVFPTVGVLSRPDGNHILLGFSRARSVDSIRAQLLKFHGEDALEGLARQAALTVRELLPPDHSPVFTDDHAPVEEMTRRMLAAQAR